MLDSPATRLVALNQQAIAILRMGIPLDFGLGTDTANQLREINDRLLTDVGRAQTADELLTKHSFPDRYAAIAQVLLATDDPAPIFDSIASGNLDREAAFNPIRQAIAEPLVILGLVYFCLIFLCTFTVPQIEAQYVQEGRAPAGVTQWLIGIREVLPLWIVGYPLTILGLWLIWRKLAKGPLLRFLPGSQSYSRWLAAESQSQRLAALMKSDVDEETALSMVGKSVAPHVPIRPIAEGIVRNGSKETRSAALSRLARFYHFIAEDHRHAYFSKGPAFLGLFVAGMIVFGYALATFLPWIEVLSNLSGLGAMHQ